MLSTKSASFVKFLNPVFTSTRISPFNSFQTSSVFRDKEDYVRDDRPNINIATLGASGHGKTTLSSSLTKLLSKTHGVPIKEMVDIDHSAGEKESKQSQNATHLEMWTSKYRYAWTDLPGSIKYVNNLIHHLPHMDVALLVVNPNEGVCKETKDQNFIAKHFNIPLVTVINKSEETDDETIDLVKMELEELDCDQDKLSIVDAVTGSGMDNFLIGLENNIPLLERKEKGPFMMPVEQSGFIPNRGVFCAGRVLQGSLSVGDSIEAFYQGNSSKTTVKDLEIFRKVSSTIQAGDRGGAFIKTKNNLELKRGSVLYNPKLGLTISDEWDVSLSTLPGEQSYNVKGDNVFFHSTNMDGKATVSPCTVSETEKAETKIKLRYKIMAKPGDPFLIRTNHCFLIGNILK